MVEPAPNERVPELSSVDERINAPLFVKVAPELTVNPELNFNVPPLSLVHDDEMVVVLPPIVNVPLFVTAPDKEAPSFNETVPEFVQAPAVIKPPTVRVTPDSTVTALLPALKA